LLFDDVAALSRRLSLILAIGFALNAIASIGSAVALLVFGMCTVAHFRVRSETGARLSLLILAVTTAGIALIAFLLDLIVNDPVSVAAMLVIVILAVILDFAWKRVARAAHRPRTQHTASRPHPSTRPAAIPLPPSTAAPRRWHRDRRTPTTCSHLTRGELSSSAAGAAARPPALAR
jgi:Ca2+/Na+ antiporter